MFTLILHYPIRGRGRSMATESAVSAHVPQIGSTINTEGLNRGTWRVDHVGQKAADGVMSKTVHLYLEEVD